MLVTPDSFLKTAGLVATATDVTAVSIDFETNGLNAYRGDTAFIIGVCIDGTTFSYKFEDAPHDHNCLMLDLLCSNKRVRYLAHNAKFEMSFFRHQWGIMIDGPIWDTEVMARLQHNNHKSYSLQNCAQRIGTSKHPPMLAWLKANGPKYHEAPEELIVPYVEQDARLSYQLYLDQCDTFRTWQEGSSVHISGLVVLEMKTTKNLFHMEHGGMALDVEYSKEALVYERGRAEESKHEFKKLTGTAFTDSAKCLAPVFTSLGIPFGKTEKGNDSFNEEALLPNGSNPVVSAVLAYRDANKRASTYWENFLAMHTGGWIHPSIRQAGAATGRFSVTDPAAQTWPDDSEDLSCVYPIRKAFPAPLGCKVVSMDYKGMELRFEVDQAQCEYMMGVITSGADMHQRVADAAGVTRSLGKRGRFLRQYGGGIEKMSKSLGITMDVARRIARALDDESPAAKQMRYDLINYARRAPFGYNWMGRRYFFDRNFEYKYPNYWNQGGCSDILRIAIDDVTALLAEKASPRTRIVLPIHDEICFYWAEEDLGLIPEVRQLMVDAYRIKKTLPMDVSVAMGPNLHDLTEMA